MNDKFPITDLDSLIDAKLDARMRAYVVYNAEEHDQTRAILSQVKHAITRGARINVHDVIHYLVGILLFLMLMFLR